MSFWIILDDSLATDELVAGAAAAALAALLASWPATRRRRGSGCGSVAGARRCGCREQVLGDTVTGVCRAGAAAGPRRAAGQRVPRRCRSGSATESMEAITRRVLLVGGRSLASEHVRARLDADRDVMVVHRLVMTTGGPGGERFHVAAIGMLPAVDPVRIVVWPRPVMDALVAYEAVSVDRGHGADLAGRRVPAARRVRAAGAAGRADAGQRPGVRPVPGALAVIQGVAADVLLGLAAAIVLASALGVLVMRDVYRKLHYVTPAALVAPALVGAGGPRPGGPGRDTGETCSPWVHGYRRPVPDARHRSGRPGSGTDGDWRPGGGRRRRPRPGDEP